MMMAVVVRTWGICECFDEALVSAFLACVNPNNECFGGFIRYPVCMGDQHASNILRAKDVGQEVYN
jgi:hypothetical protein